MGEFEEIITERHKKLGDDYFRPNCLERLGPWCASVFSKKVCGEISLNSLAVIRFREFFLISKREAEIMFNKNVNEHEHIVTMVSSTDKKELRVDIINKSGDRRTVVLRHPFK